MSTADNTPAPDLTHLATEHVMRAVDDETLLYAFLDAAPASAAAYAALGALTTRVPFELTAGSPVHAWLRGHPLNPHWRDTLPAQPGSLWQQLEFLETLYGPQGTDTCDCPFERLSQLRALSRTDIGIPIL